jgi:hypothetical protein
LTPRNCADEDAIIASSLEALCEAVRAPISGAAHRAADAPTLLPGGEAAALASSPAAFLARLYPGVARADVPPAAPPSFAALLAEAVHAPLARAAAAAALPRARAALEGIASRGAAAGETLDDATAGALWPSIFGEAFTRALPGVVAAAAATRVAGALALRSGGGGGGGGGGGAGILASPSHALAFSGVLGARTLSALAATALQLTRGGGGSREGEGAGGAASGSGGAKGIVPAAPAAASAAPAAAGSARGNAPAAPAAASAAPAAVAAAAAAAQAGAGWALQRGLFAREGADAASEWAALLLEDARAWAAAADRRDSGDRRGAAGAAEGGAADDDALPLPAAPITATTRSPDGRYELRTALSWAWIDGCTVGQVAAGVREGGEAAGGAGSAAAAADVPASLADSLTISTSLAALAEAVARLSGLPHEINRALPAARLALAAPGALSLRRLRVELWDRGVGGVGTSGKGWGDSRALSSATQGDAAGSRPPPPPPPPPPLFALPLGEAFRLEAGAPALTKAAALLFLGAVDERATGEDDGTRATVAHPARLEGVLQLLSGAGESGSGAAPGAGGVPAPSALSLRSEASRLLLFRARDVQTRLAAIAVLPPASAGDGSAAGAAAGASDPAAPSSPLPARLAASDFFFLAMSLRGAGELE